MLLDLVVYKYSFHHGMRHSDLFQYQLGLAVLLNCQHIAKMQFSTSLSLVALLGVASAQDLVSFGPAFSLGPTKSWIREATTTLVLPKTPSPAKDRLALWPGMGTSSGSLIQALAVAFSDPAS